MIDKASTSAGIALSASDSVRWPPPVRPGDRVGVAALSGAVDPQELRRGLAELRALGLEPVSASNLGSRRGVFAGSDDERLEAFHQLAADPSLRAIFFARGGYGLTRILPSLDWELLARYPRAYVGYSDLTPFLLQVVQRLGLVAFHGPMVAADLARGLSPLEARSLLSVLGGLGVQSWPLRGVAATEATEGPLLGGCLSLLASVVGTDVAPRLDGCVLFLEDVAEPFYRVDRMLTQLRHSGTLNGLRGLVFGHIVDAHHFSSTGTRRGSAGGPADAKHRGVAVRSSRDLDERGHRERELWAASRGCDPFELLLSEQQLLGDLGLRLDGRRGSCEAEQGWLENPAEPPQFALGWGLSAGHGMPNWTLPLGATVRLQPGRKSLELVPAGG